MEKDNLIKDANDKRADTQRILNTHIKDNLLELMLVSGISDE